MTDRVAQLVERFRTLADQTQRSRDDWQSRSEVVRFDATRARDRALADTESTARTALADVERRRVEEKMRIEAEAVRLLQSIERESRSTLEKLERRHADAMEEAQRRRDEQRWEAGTLFEAGHSGLREQTDKRLEELESTRHALADIEAQARDHLARARMSGAAESPPASTAELSASDTPLADRLTAATEQVDTLFDQLISSRPIRYFRSGVDLFMLLFLPPLFAALTWISGRPVREILAAAILSLAALVIGNVLLYLSARASAKTQFTQLAAAIQTSRRLGKACHDETRAHYEKSAKALMSRRDNDQATAEILFQATTKKLRQVNEIARSDAENARVDRLQAATEAKTLSLKELETSAKARRSEIEAERSAAVEEAQRTYRDAIARLEAGWNAAVSDLSSHWRQDLDQTADLGQSLAARPDALPIVEPVPAVPNAPQACPETLRLGTFNLALGQDPLPRPTWDAITLDNAPTSFEIPGLVPFPERSSLLLQVDGSGRDAAVGVLQSVMLRILTTAPAGKVRFTIFDPVGLGQNFAAFMHLKEYDELMVTSRIWTEPGQIEQRLADLSDQVETIIQGYLRSEYQSILEYNAVAGEVAEPFRYVVFANLPTNLSDIAARRLMSLASSGPRCGVHLLLSLDTRQPTPPGLDLDDLRRRCSSFRWSDGRFRWDEPTLSEVAWTFDSPPPPEEMVRRVHALGARARTANRVEVPFRFISPTRPDWWTADSRSDLRVSVGRSGATKRQELNLGHGTSQHVLIAGRTGSGKSTLLHSLITNLAITYAPDEVELFLIDFKKGVEFKTYATHNLPHARVVAIESEREFGLSVLQRLDAVLRERGDRFRQVEAQNVAAFRAARPDEPMPRLMLIVDEFQEFFVEDDRIAQDAALLLDRLVRQGRAFGIHIVLGSQTLGGAYTLARSTLGQMGVRIALQCSEADAHLILSEENTAARLLTRPGEAIYNDANGLPEGNHVFQVAWLPDEERDGILRQVATDATRRDGRRPAPIVFEGNALPTLDACHPLAESIETTSDRPAPATLRTWLGEPIAIQAPTSAEFARTGSGHLILVGQNEDMALGQMGAVIVSLAASAGSPRISLLDGTPEDSPRRVVLGGLVERLPGIVERVEWRSVAPHLEEMAVELKRRQDDGLAAPDPWFVLIHDLARFRMLRRAEDDFGMSYGRSEGPAPPSENLATLLREGPSVGLHVVLWSDTLSALQRVVERSVLRDLDQKVLFQMSSNDSSALVDSPIANRLGMVRALYVQESEGRLEKFRPYRRPDDAWLDRACHQILARRPAVKEGSLNIES